LYLMGPLQRESERFRIAEQKYSGVWRKFTELDCL
jgi:hypothetical protein